MPLDANIILGQRQFQQDNPMDIAQKAMSLRALSQQNTAYDKQINDQNTMNAILKKNIITGADGSTSLDKQAVANDLYKLDPSKAEAYKQNTATQDLELLKHQADAKAQLALSITDEPSYLLARNKALQMNLPGADKLPPQYPGESFVQNMQYHTLGEKDRLAHEEKLREFDLKDKERNEARATRMQNAGISRDDRQAKQGDDMYKAVVQMKESSRQSPEYKQAQMDLLASNKALMIVDKYGGDLNKVPTTLAPILTTELAKVAGGGVPTESQIHEMSPDTLKAQYGKFMTRVTGNPHDLNAGEILKLQVEYLNDLRENAASALETQNKYLETTLGTKAGKNNLDAFTKANAMELKGLLGKHGRSGQKSETPPIPAQSHPEANQAVEWAKANPNDPRAQDIMQRVGQ